MRRRARLKLGRAGVIVVHRIVFYRRNGAPVAVGALTPLQALYVSVRAFIGDNFSSSQR